MGAVAVYFALLAGFLLGVIVGYCIRPLHRYLTLADYNEAKLRMPDHDR